MARSRGERPKRSQRSDQNLPSLFENRTGNGSCCCDVAHIAKLAYRKHPKFMSLASSEQYALRWSGMPRQWLGTRAYGLSEAGASSKRNSRFEGRCR